jgi:Double zinc ribbon
MMADMPFHDRQEVYGVSEDCKFNDHNMCRSPRCGCSCHRQTHIPNTNGGDRINNQPSGLVQSGLDKYCPTCKVKASSDQNYCTADGSKLSSLRCPECGTPGEESHVYCGYCGQLMKADQRLEEAAIGSRVTDNIAQSPEEAEAMMKAALANRVMTVDNMAPRPKTVPAPPKISIGMYK